MINEKTPWTNKKVTDFVPYLIPTPDYKAVAETISKINIAILYSGKVPLSFIGAGNMMIPEARTDMLKQFYDKLENQIGVQGEARGFMLDSDIFLHNEAQDIIEMMNYADAHNYNVVANYHASDFTNLIFKDSNHKRISNPELEALDEWAEVESAGLGFYYGRLPKGYVYRSSKDASEDINFFRDNDLRPHLCKKIRLGHLKLFMF